MVILSSVQTQWVFSLLPQSSSIISILLLKPLFGAILWDI